MLKYAEWIAGSTNSRVTHWQTTRYKKATHRPRGIFTQINSIYRIEKKNTGIYTYIYIYMVADWQQVDPKGGVLSGKAFHSETVLESWGRAWRSTSHLYRSAIWPCGYCACHLGNGDFLLLDVSSGFFTGNSCGCWDFGVFFKMFFPKGIGKFCGSSVHGKN